jgi:hypothetical protein
VDLELFKSVNGDQTEEDIIDAQEAQYAFNGIIEKIAFIDKDGTVDHTKLSLDYQIADEPEEDEEDDDEDEPNYPLQHYVNIIGWNLLKQNS